MSLTWSQTILSCWKNDNLALDLDSSSLESTVLVKYRPVLKQQTIQFLVVLTSAKATDKVVLAVKVPFTLGSTWGGSRKCESSER
jgi:hypothetical protein